MKSKILLLALLALPVLAMSQKVKIDDNVATVDGVEFCFYEKKNMANDASVKGLQATNEEIFLTFQSYNDPNQITKSNPEGKVRWIEVNFVDLGLKCEVPSNTHKWMVKLFLENNIFVDGKVDSAAAQRLVNKYGTKFTDGRPGGNVNIIINNN